MRLTPTIEPLVSGSTEQRDAAESSRWLEEARAKYRERAREQAQQRTERAKHELGRMAFDTVERYFPEEAQARRRRSGMTLFVVGLGIGILLRHLVGR